MKISIVGAGKMAIALAKGLVRTNTIKAENIIGSAPDKLGMANQLHAFKAQGSRITHDNKDCVRDSDVIFLMTKGVHSLGVLRDIAPALSRDQILVSVIAGFPLSLLCEPLPEHAKVIRSMPNTPMLVGQGAGCYSANPNVGEDDKKLVEKLFASCGFIHEVPEMLMDAVCGLSGSGPAYVYVFIESLTDGGVRMGLPRELAAKLAVQTVLGSAMMVSETTEHPSKLKDDVCSPGGSTIAAIHTLDTAGFRGLVIDAVRNATLRTTELALEAKEKNGAAKHN
ncbi:uncharacterized protein LOC142337734 [Convolutriloba macropyga]|uniref:uncharacterized protein LOC142337734 n=1 Tax=Convolutriloba macropyga TaxID=536237 RepID=UPI003F5235A5